LRKRIILTATGFVCLADRPLKFLSNPAGCGTLFGYNSFEDRLRCPLYLGAGCICPPSASLGIRCVHPNISFIWFPQHPGFSEETPLVGNSRRRASDGSSSCSSFLDRRASRRGANRSDGGISYCCLFGPNHSIEPLESRGHHADDGAAALFVSSRVGDVLGAYLYAYFGGFGACIIAITAVYSVMLPKLSESITRTTDGHFNAT
jgi:hypothetical protein